MIGASKAFIGVLLTFFVSMSLSEKVQAAGVFESWIASERFLVEKCLDNKLVKEFIALTLTEGFQELREINPALTDEVELIRFNKTLKVNCEVPPKGGADIRRYDKEAVMRIGNMDVSDSNSVVNKMLIFHEFLHFLDLDNYPVEDHNREEWREALVKYGVVKKFTDVIYACSQIIFPGYKIITDGQHFEVNGFWREEMTVTCRNARICGKMTCVNTSD